MPTQQLVKDFLNFGGGLVTESNPLSFPPNTSKVLENVILNRNGTAFRRLGVDVEANARQGPLLSSSTFATDAVSAHRWRAVNGNGELEFVVVQFDGYLIIHDTDGGNYSGTSNVLAQWEYEPLTISSSSTSWRSTPIDSTVGLGRFFGCSQHISPFYIEYDEDTMSFTVRKLSLKIRDTDGLDETNDTSSSFTGIPTESDDHLILDTEDLIAETNTTTEWTMSAASAGSPY